MKKLFAHATGAVIEGGLIAVLAIGLVAGSAFAGKPVAGGTTSGFSVDDGSFAQTTTAHRGSSTATWVRARCFQNGSLVYEQYVSYGSSQTATLTLGPTPMWSSGAATCSGEEGFWRNGTRWRVVGSDSFTVAG